MLEVVQGGYLVLLVEVLYGGCQPAPVAIFTGNKPTRDAAKSDKMEVASAAPHIVPWLRLVILSVSVTEDGELERRSARPFRGNASSSTAGASARDEESDGDARQMLTPVARAQVRLVYPLMQLWGACVTFLFYLSISPSCNTVLPPHSGF